MALPDQFTYRSEWDALPPVSIPVREQEKVGSVISTYFSDPKDPTNGLYPNLPPEHQAEVQKITQEALAALLKKIRDEALFTQKGFPSQVWSNEFEEQFNQHAGFGTYAEPLGNLRKPTLPGSLAARKFINMTKQSPTDEATENNINALIRLPLLRAVQFFAYPHKVTTFSDFMSQELFREPRVPGAPHAHPGRVLHLGGPEDGREDRHTNTLRRRP